MRVVQFVFLGALVISSSSAAVTQFDQPASTKPAQTLAAVAVKAHATRIVDADYQLSDQERFLLAFSRLRANAEQGSR